MLRSLVVRCAAALAVALGRMVHDNQITRDRAKEIVRMVLRDNAIAAYHLAAR